MSFTSAELRELKAAAPRKGLFFRLQAQRVIRLWLGVGDIKPGIDALDTVAGATYRGLGGITDFPAFNELADGSAERIDFSLSGIEPKVLGEVAPLIADQQTAIAGKLVSAGYGLFDADWQLLGGVHWSWFGFADYLKTLVATPDDTTTPESWTLVLSAGSYLTGRARRGFRYWNDQDHQSRSAGDRFCERAVLYEQEVEKTWPRF